MLFLVKEEILGIIFNIFNFTKIGDTKAQRGEVICPGPEHQLLHSLDKTPSPGQFHAFPTIL